MKYAKRRRRFRQKANPETALSPDDLAAIARAKALCQRLIARGGFYIDPTGFLNNGKHVFVASPIGRE